MMDILLWSACALGLPASGWLASAWFYKRRIGKLQLQVKALRQAAAVQTDQARQQIELLQAQLKAPRGQRPARPGTAAAPAAAPKQVSEADESWVLPDDGFAQTEICADGFEPTRLMA